MSLQNLDLAAVLDVLGLTAYGAGQVIGAETAEDPSAITRRWQRWANGQSLKTLHQIQADLMALSEASGVALSLELKIGPDHSPPTDPG